MEDKFEMQKADLK